MAAVPKLSQEAVLVTSTPMPADTPIIKGYDFNQGIDYEALLKSYKYLGFQGTSLGQAIDEVNRMLNWRLSDEPVLETDDEDFAHPGTALPGQHSLVDCIVTTAGGIEEDFIKCLGPTYLGEFSLKGADLRMRGLNRTGNLLVPNDNYCKFEDWLMPILDTMLAEQKTNGTVWTPSTIIHRLGKEINNEESVYYWAYKNNIPVFCPALTDGSLGDMIYFHSFKNPGLIVDIAADIAKINNMAVFAKKTGMVILGGGVVKHHICNANLMRNGADFSVYINTGQEFDGSDGGARPDEAVSWGKIKLTANPVKVYADATIAFPLLVGETFARKVFADKAKANQQ
ncbi:deoxyhypusine synthase [Capsaspora owczarzaki ATCC 30864]|uniref:deoxyhypusine synthase n=1 Tax=Capsaspora owczarzaki (strain ATCC 30864) TaxID=595528 RepID=UPI0001FE2664|nr:deoxyhypusine synthase [Capsaspora owczarzaki ATCC 30864]|eukprot:XP_004363506.1 deoxyhypusine synthase [Capsaspora owczarzaki ATCC 30864]